MVLLLLAALLLCLVLIVVSLVGIQVRDVQLPVRYSDFGATNTYRDRWYYLFVFPLFGLLVASFHSLVAIKLLGKSRQLAGLFLAVTTCLLVFGIAVTLAVLHLVSVSL